MSICSPPAAYASGLKVTSSFLIDGTAAVFMPLVGFLVLKAPFTWTKLLTWPAFDRETWTVRLHAKDAKTGHGRVVALEGPLRAIIERRLAARRLDSPLIFHRRGGADRRHPQTLEEGMRGGRVVGKLPYDLRRTAIRNRVRAGVEPAVAMKISGHRTRAVFDRYNIIAEADLRDAVLKTQADVASLPTERTVLPLREAREEKPRKAP